MKNILTIFLMIAAFAVYGQKGIVNNGARIVVENGAYIKIQGDNTSGYTNKSFGSKHGRIDLDGEIVVDGFFTNNATANSVFINLDGTGTVSFEGSSSQAIGGINPIAFEGLNLSGNDITLNTNISINGALNFGSGLLDLNSNVLSFESGASVSGTPSTSSMIIPGTNGIVRKYYASASSFTYPIGENSGTAVYLPVISNITSGTFGSGAYLDLQMYDSKHPENSNLTDYISRYWDLSENNISSFLASLSFTYANADISGTESNLYALGYDGTFWDVYNAATTATNKLTATVSEFYKFTGGGFEAVSPQISWVSDGSIEENMEGGEEIIVSLVNDQFVGTLTEAQWNVSGLPNGVTVGSIAKTAIDAATITLSGNRLDDYDSDVTISLSVNASQFVNASSGNLSADNDITITADDDDELVEMADDGGITEGSENGEIISVTITGGTFAQTITTASWVAENMPAGVTIGSVNRISATLVHVVLSGDATEDYDSDITDFQLTVPDDDVNEYVGSDFVLTSGVTFSAIDESMQISMSDGGTGIDEESEGGHVITVIINERVFAATLNPASWSLINLPTGVSLGSINRESDTEVSLTLSGNRTQDYDDDILNTELRIQIGQIVDVATQVIVNSGVTFNAIDDDESIVIALDGDGITEGSEDLEVITATLIGGTFSEPLSLGNWTLNNLPQGVSIGSVSRIDHNHAALTLSGNRQVDFDSNISSVDLDVADSDVDDFSSTTLSSDNAVTITANSDDEVIVLSGGPFTEGVEDEGVITATLSGGTFNTVTISDVSLDNLPTGVTLGDLVQNSNTELQLTLSGNATGDYDADITNVTLSVNASVVDETSVDISGTGITFEATVEPVVIVLSDNGDLYESEEDEKILVIEMSQDTFIPELLLSEFEFFNLPEGVVPNSINRVSETLLEIHLLGNRTKDYDDDILDAGVTINASQLVVSSEDLTASAGWVFVATDDAEYVSFSTESTIIEGAEDGVEIQLSISGGTFASTLSTDLFTFDALPPGVVVGAVQRTSPTAAVITLQNNATADYDIDIPTSEIVIVGTQIDDLSSANLIATGSVVFEAVVETQNLFLSAVIPLNEQNLQDAVVGLKLAGSEFSTPIDEANFVLNNAPSGLSIQNLTLVDPDSVSIQLAFDGTDFDVDYDAFSVLLQADGSSIDLSVSSNAISIEAIVEPGSMLISHAGLAENNLAGGVIDVSLVGDVFVDSYLDMSSFTLLSAPEGLFISQVNYIDVSTATVTLDFEGVDFDVDISDFAIVIDAIEVAANVSYTSNTLLISAINDEEDLTVVGGSFVEGSEDGGELVVTLSGGTFASSVSVADVVLNNAPVGVAIGNLVRNSAQQVTITLQGNASEDYDVDLNGELVFDAASIFDTDEQLTATGFVFDAIIESVGLVLTDNGDLIENDEDGKVLEIKLNQDVFISELILSEFEFSNLPEGVVPNSITRVNDTLLEIQLLGNRTKDYDNDILNAGVTIKASQLVVTSEDLSASSGWLFVAIDDPEYISFSTESNITEGAEDGTEVNVSVSGGTLAEVLDEAKWSLTGLPGGVAIGSISRIDGQNAIITLSGNASADYDTDIVVNELVVSDSQIDDYELASLVGSGAITFNAFVETQDLVLTPLIALDESNLDGAQLALKLVGATFVSPVQLSDLVLNNSPVGIALSGISEISADSVVIDLVFDGTDFDVDYPDFSVTLLAAGSSLGLSVNSNVTPINAIVEVDGMEISHAGLTEENLNGAVIDVSLINGEFADGTLDVANFSLNNAPLGADIADVTYVSNTTATFEIIFDGADFDSNITNFSLTMAAAESSTGHAYVSNVLTITATDDEEEIAFVTPQSVIEGDEDGHVFLVELTGGTFADELNALDWSLTYMPQGVSIGNVLSVDATHAEVYLSGNATADYDVSEIVTLSIVGSQYDYGSLEISTSNNFTFEALIEDLYTLTDTILEAEINTINLPFVIEGDWLTNLSPSVTDVILQNSPVGLEIVSINVIDSVNFTIGFNYTGESLAQDESFSIMLVDNILHGLESLISNEVVIDAEVGIAGFVDGVELYLTGNSLVLKQSGKVRKGTIWMFETNGRKARRFDVEAKTINVFDPLLKENVYIILFISDDGRQYKAKGFLKN